MSGPDSFPSAWRSSKGVRRSLGRSGCDFEPERLVVDPDAMVLQLRREHAETDLGG